MEAKDTDELKAYEPRELQEIIRQSPKRLFRRTDVVVILDADAIFDDQSNLVGGVETERQLSALNEYGAALCIIMLGKTKEQADAIIATLKSRQLSGFIQFVVYDPSSRTKNGLVSDCDQLYREDGGSFRQETKLFAIGDFTESRYPKGLQVWPIASVDQDASTRSTRLHGGLQNVINSPETDFFKPQSKMKQRSVPVPPNDQTEIELRRVPLIKPAEPFSRSFGNWVFWHIFRPPLFHSFFEKLIENEFRENDYKQKHLEMAIHKKNPDQSLFTILRIAFVRTLKSALLKTFEVEGYDLTTGEITYTNRATEDGNRTALFEDEFSFGMLLTSYFALPNRPEAVIDAKGRASPKLTPWRILKNFFGDVDLADDTSSEKKWVEILLLPVKIIIAAFNVVIWPFKFIRNNLKVGTELLPLLVDILVPIMVFIAVLIPTLIAAGLTFVFAMGLMPVSWKITKALLNMKVPVFIKGPLVAVFGLPMYAISLAITLAIVPLALAAVALALTCIAATIASIWAYRLLLIVARAVTSPLKNLRMALAYGRELKGTLFGIRIGNVLGVLGVLICVSLTMIGLSVLLPFVITAALPLITAFSQLPAVAAVIAWASNLTWVVASLAWLSHLPVVVASLSGINIALTTVGATLGVVFAPITGALSAFLGISLSGTVIAAGAMIGVIVAPVLMGLNLGANYLSKRWHNWHVGGPVTWLSTKIPTLLQWLEFTSSDQTTHELEKSSGGVPLGEIVSTDKSLTSQEAEVQPRPGAQNLVGEKGSAVLTADQRESVAEGAATKSVQDPKKPNYTVTHADDSFVGDVPSASGTGIENK